MAEKVHSEPSERLSWPTEIRERDAKVKPRKVFLTFDDGPNPIWTPKILDILRQFHVPGTFFVLGAYAAEHPELIRRMISDGHEVANHTMTHLDLSQCNRDVLRREILDTNIIITKASPGLAVRFLRAPYGVWTPDVCVEGMNAGLTPLHWSVDPQDWARPGVDLIVDTVLATVEPGAIVLLHDGSPPNELASRPYTASREQTVRALPRLISALKERNFVISSLPKLRGQINPVRTA
ncbi:chitooligosaccharide deacetylase NodB [Cupriavidus taiwanensis]|uniref:NodB chitooligosaccharide deacetylase n=1 Tax=Cupriavidus taiwanensis TaxID=164546 RepID=A0A375JA94_9BURK|nr:chitooligosaccharide deacetylase NodB [Cupriavidus taiwanensis]SPS02105.1 NodB chitooligosaccharide deacetylase [Cupriavidus taiwanensis]